MDFDEPIPTAMPESGFKEGMWICQKETESRMFSEPCTVMGYSGLDEMGGLWMLTVVFRGS